MAREFWLSDRAWSAIEPLLPSNQPGARRVDDKRVISGIVHVLNVQRHSELARGRHEELAHVQFDAGAVSGAAAGF